MKIKANKGAGASGMRLVKDKEYEVGDGKGQVSMSDARYLCSTGACSPVDAAAKTATARNKGVTKANSGLV